jgi:hypothetical protein
MRGKVLWVMLERRSQEKWTLPASHGHRCVSHASCYRSVVADAHGGTYQNLLAARVVFFLNSGCSFI